MVKSMGKKYYVKIKIWAFYRVQRGQLRREWATRRQTVWKAWEHMKTRKPASLRSRGAPRLSEQRAQSPEVRSTAAPQWWLVELIIPPTDTRQASSSRAAFSWAPTCYISSQYTVVNIKGYLSFTQPVTFEQIKE